MKKQVKIYATDEDRAWLKAHGGATKAVEQLIREERQREDEQQTLASIEASLERLETTMANITRTITRRGPSIVEGEEPVWIETITLPEDDAAEVEDAVLGMF